MRTTILALLLLCSCGGGASSNIYDLPLASIVKVDVHYGVPATPGRWGHAKRLSFDSWEVVVDPSIEFGNVQILGWLIAHEIGHCALGPMHVESGFYRCIMDSNDLDPSTPEPCPDEALLMAQFGAGHSIEIVACDPALVAGTVAAINLWNTPSAFKSFNGSQGE